MNIANKIKFVRTTKGLTQKELGERVGVSDKAVSKWERSVAMPDIGTIPKLCKILEISMDEFLGEEVKTDVPAPITANKRKRLLRILLPIMSVAFFVIIAAATWSLQGIRTYKVLTESMSPAIKQGQTIVVKPTSTKNIKVGDIITYATSNNASITHRVIEIVDGEDFWGGVWFVTKGDKNDHADEQKVRERELIGKVIFVF